MKQLISFLLLATALSFSALGADRPTTDNPFKNYSNDIILKWNAIALETMSTPAYDPMVGSRIFTMVHLAMHDALNNIEPVFETYLAHQQERKADPIAAIAAAAYTVLVETYPQKKEQLDAALAESLKDIKSNESRQLGISMGTKVGKAIFALRKDDGAFQNPVVELNNPKIPGMYQPVPPMPFVYAPFWATLSTFGLKTPDQFRVQPMPSLTSDAYTQHYNEVKLKGAKVNSTRTAEETAIAKYWYEFSEVGWNRIATVVAADQKLDLYNTARLLALVNMAMADSYIAGWDAKFFYNFWRPFTAIRAAATDGNEQTTEDVAWEPLLNTPPVQDYPSTHSILGNAAATVLSELVGKSTTFTMTSPTAEPGQSSRTFSSFKQAAIENADSRVFAGLHFRFSCDRGLEMGNQIGSYIEKTQLRPRSGS